jgi:hypothetical protein
MAAKNKTTKKTGKAHPHSWSLVLLGVIIFLGLGVGLISAYRAGATRQRDEMPKPRPIASGTALEKSRSMITEAFLESSTTGCKDDDLTQVGRTAVFYKYLRVNLHNDRAVIRGCNNHDTLLAYVNGKWQATGVLLNLDGTASPGWQKACDVADITRTETELHVEDIPTAGNNYALCRQLQQGKIVTSQN